MLTTLKSIQRAADICHVIGIIVFAGILAITAGAEQHSAPRSERRDPAQGGRAKASAQSSSARGKFQRRAVDRLINSGSDGHQSNGSMQA